MAVEKRQELYTALRLHPDDTGSSSVQIVALSQEIEKLTAHLAKNKKDYSCRRSLLKKVAARKIHLKYLKRRDAEQHKLVLNTLGLKR